MKQTLISVTEKLPPVTEIFYDGDDFFSGLKESLPVVVLLDDGSYHIATLNQNYDEETGEAQGEPYWFDENRTEDGDWLKGHVTHWMPLPKSSVVSKTDNIGKKGREK